MNEILLINPRKKRRTRRVAKKSTSKRRKTLTSRRVVRRSSPRRTTTRRRTVKSSMPRHYLAKGDSMPRKRRSTRRRKTTRRNPARRHYARRAVSRARTSFMGLDFVKALKGAPLTLAGMLGAKWMAARFNGGTHTDPESWQWDDYLKSAAGAAAAGFLANMVKPGSGQKVMEGGIWITLYYLLQNELIQPSDALRGQFGADEQYYPAEYLGAQADYAPGDVEYNSAGQPYMLGENYQWQPIPETMSGELEPVGPLGQLSPVGPLGSTDDAYRKMLLGDA